MYFSQVIIVRSGGGGRVTEQHRIFYERVAVGRLPQRALAPAARAGRRAAALSGGRAGGAGACLLSRMGGIIDCLFLLLFLTHFDTHAVCPIAGCSFCDWGGAGHAIRHRRHNRAEEIADGSLLFAFVPPSLSVESSSFVPVFAISSPCFIDFHWAEPLPRPSGLSCSQASKAAGGQLRSVGRSVGRPVGRAERRAGGEDDDVG